LYQWIQRLISRLASSKERKFLNQTHSSFKLLKNLSIIPFCSGVYGVTNSWGNP